MAHAHSHSDSDESPPASPSSSSSPHTQGLHTESTHRERWASRSTYWLACCGAAVGLGNCWRFPFLAYKNGGGAFLVPYLLAVVLIGFPLLLLELSLGQKTQVGVVNAFKQIHRSYRAVGWIMVAGSFIIVSYYCVLMSWAVYYLVQSFRDPLPWKEHAERYFYDHSLDMPNAPGVEDTSHLVYWHVLGSAAAWLFVFFAIHKGVKSSGWVVWVTVPLPLVLLVVLFFRGISLSGAWGGLRFFLEPDFAKIFTEPKIWTEAVTQIFFSLSIAAGIMGAFASFNDQRQNVFQDALIIAAVNSGTSVLAGLVIFSVLGHMSHETGVDIEDVIRGGPGLAFVVFPEALTLMPGSNVFSVMFFVTLLTLGIDSAFALTEAVVTVLRDAFNLRSQAKVVACVCTAGFLAGMLFTTNTGLLWLELFDHYVSAYLLVPVGLAEAIAVAHTYGAARYLAEITEMTGVHFSANWRFIWRWVIPITLTVVFFAQFAEDLVDPPETIFGKEYPGWALAFGWIVALSPSVCGVVMVARDYWHTHPSAQYSAHSDDVELHVR